MSNIEEANNPSHYLFLVVAIIVGLVGVFFRFAGESFLISAISNVFLIVGTVLAITAVFRIMK